jgi:transcription elongation factor
VFKPLNLEGFTDNLDIERNLVVKYFEQGDPVRVVEGNYQGETGVVMNVDEDNIMMPIVKIDSTQRELAINTNNLKGGKESD